MTSRAALVAGCLAWACYAVSLLLPAMAFEGGELFRNTWRGWDALVRGWVVWVAPFASFGSGGGLVAALFSFWLGVLWLTNLLVLVSPFLVFRPRARFSASLGRALPVAAAANATFVFTPDVQPAVGYYLWLTSFILLSIAARGSGHDDLRKAMV